MPKTGSRSEPNQEISYSRLYDGTTNKRELLVAFHPRLFLFFFRSLVFMFPFLRTCFPLSDSTLHAAIPSLFLYSCRFLHSHSPFHFFPLSLSIPTTPTFRLTCRTKLQNAAPPPMAAFRSSCFVRATSCVLVEKKNGPSEETVWRRRRGACFSSEYRRGVYAALIVGTQFSFAAIQHSTKTFLFFFSHFINPPSNPISIVHRSIHSRFFFCTARQLTASSIPRSPLFLDIIVFSNAAFVLTRFFFLIYFFIYFIAVLFLLLGSCRRKARVSLVIGSWTVDVLCAFLLSTIPVCIYICVD